MSLRRGHRLVSSWIALFAILLATFVPTATSALSSSSGLPWDRMCSAATMEADRGDRSDSPATPHVFDHCPFCALQADLAPPPRPDHANVAPAAAFRALPLAFTHAPRGNAVRASAQPRAPPRFV